MTIGAFSSMMYRNSCDSDMSQFWREVYQSSTMQSSAASASAPWHLVSLSKDLSPQHPPPETRAATAASCPREAIMSTSQASVPAEAP